MRRAAVGVLAGTLAFTGGAIAAGVSPANAAPGFDFERLAGDNRYQTARDIALDTFDTTTDVVLASGEERNFPDALTGNYLAGDLDAPILLTQTRDLPDATLEALEELDAQTVHIVGGEEAVSQAVERQLEAADYDVVRIGGDNRYETAQDVALEVGGSDGANVGEDEAGARTAILGNGQNFADILTSGPESYALQFPLAITRPNELPDETRDVLQDLGIERVLIVGGVDAVSQSVEAEVAEIVDGDVERFAGGNRYETAAEFAEFAYSELGFDDSHINLARGDRFADALTGGPHAGVDLAPIVLTEPNQLTAVTEAFLEDNCPTLQDGHIFGGPNAVSEDVEDDAVEAASNCDAAPGDVTITPTGDDSNIAAGENFVGSIDANGGTIENVAVRGDCIDDNAALTEDGTAGGDFEFSIPVNQDATVGECDITFTVTIDGQEITQVVTIVVEEAAAPVAAFDLEPDTAETVTVVTGNPEADASDNRTYTATGLTVGEEYRVTLVLADNVRVSADGTATFLADADANSATGFSAVAGNVAADIVGITGEDLTNADSDTATAGLQTQTFAFTAEATTVQIAVDGDAAESVRPVLYLNGAAGQTDEQGGTSARLEVRAAAAGEFAAADEAFDLGGVTVFVSATTNQDFAVSPQEEATNIFSEPTDDPATTTANETNRGRHSFTVTGLDDTQTFDIALFRAEDVTVDANGVVSFTDADGTNGAGNDVADFTEADAEIELVNGNDVVDTNGVVLDVRPVNGSITFVIDSEFADEVRAVVFRDADSGTTEASEGTAVVDLDLDANNQAIVAEGFGIGGQKNFEAPLAVASVADPNQDGRVITLDEVANQFGLDLDLDVAASVAGNFLQRDVDVLFSFDANDVFRVNGAQVTLEQFELQLSRGDFVVVDEFTTEASLVSSFNITDDSPDLTSVTAAAGTGAESDDVILTIAAADVTNEELFSSFTIQRATVTNGEPGDFATVEVVENPRDADLLTLADLQVILRDQPLGTFQFRVVGTIDGDTSNAVTTAVAVTTTAPAADATAPADLDTRLTADNGFAGVLDSGDVFKVVFDETIAAPDAGDVLRVQDLDLTVADITAGTNANFTVNTTAETVGDTSRAAGTVLTVTLTAQPTIVAAGAMPGVQFSAQIVNSAGVTDTAGNRLDITGSTDLSIDVELTDQTAPTVTAGTASGTTATFTSNEALSATTVASADFTETSAAAITDVGVSADGRTITVTFDAALAAGDNVTLNANMVGDLSGNVGPTASVTGTATA